MQVETMLYFDRYLQSKRCLEEIYGRNYYPSQKHSEVSPGSYYLYRLMDKEAYLKKYVSYIDSFKSEYQEDYRILEDDYYHRVHYYTSQSTYYRKRRLAEDHFLNYMKRYYD